MKKLLFILLLLIISFSCTDQLIDRKVNYDKISVDEAMQRFSSETTIQQTDQSSDRTGFNRRLLTKSPDWENAYYKNLSIGSALIVPVKFNDPIYYKPNSEVSIPLNAMTNLLFYFNIKKQLQMEIITSVPSFDESDIMANQLFKGTIWVEKWNGDFIRGYYYKNDKVYSTGQSYDSNTKSGRVEMMQLTICADLYSCVTVMSDPPSGTACSYMGQECAGVYVDDGGSDSSSGGSPSGGGSSPTTFDYGSVATSNTYIVSGTIGNAITDPKGYFSCFDQTKYAAVTIYVDQPSPGSRDPYDGTDVGHTFISISQQIGSNYIVRVFGFYPQAQATPLTPSDPGTLGDDGTHQYDVSLTVYVSASQLTNAINYAVSSSANTYNLNTYNCTNFGIQFMSKCGVALPSTTGTWPGGQGCDPGDLGEDLKSVSGAVTNTSYAPNTSGNCATYTIPRTIE